MGTYHVHNANADEMVEADDAQEAMELFMALHPEEKHNSVFIFSHAYREGQSRQNHPSNPERRNVFDKEGEDGVPPVHP